MSRRMKPLSRSNRLGDAELYSTTGACIFFLNRLIWSACLIAFIAGCTNTSPIPVWFDSIQRIPLRQVTVDGHRLFYLDQGVGPPVVLIHGIAASMWHWEYQLEPLAKTHRVIILDLLGSGLSDKPNIDYNPDNMLNSVRGFMDTLGVAQASLIGNSMGAGIAIGMALEHPNRVDRLVLIDGLPANIREHLSSPLFRKAMDSNIPVWVGELGNWFAGRGTTEAILQELVFDTSKLTPGVIDRSYRNRQRGGLIGPLLSLSRNLPLWESGYANRIGEVRKPTLIIWGDHDKLFTVSTGQGLQRTIEGSVLEVIQDAGHIPQWERPELVNQLLEQFLIP